MNDKLKAFLTFDLPQFALWVARRPIAFLTDLWHDVAHFFSDAGKPRSGMSFFIIILVVAAFSERRDLMMISLAAYAVLWTIYSYRSKKYVADYRKAVAERVKNEPPKAP